MWTSQPTQTRGQVFKANQDANIAKRTTAVKAVVPVFVGDIHAKINADSAKDIQQKVFVYNIADILRDPTLYTKSAFAKAIGTSLGTPYPEELILFTDGVVDAAKDQDYEVRIRAETITIDFTNVAILVEDRIAAEKIAAEVAEAAKLKAAADKVAQ